LRGIVFIHVFTLAIVTALIVACINLIPLLVLFAGFVDNANMKVFHMIANFAATVIALILWDVAALQSLLIYWLLFVAYYASLTTFANASEIRANLFLGNFQAGRSETFLRERGITHVLEFFDSPQRRNQLLPECSGIVHRQMFFEDRAHARLADIESEAFAFLDDALVGSGKVLVHCTMGVSRSASVVTFYLMRRESMSFRDAYDHVQTRRPCVDPNASFRKQLQDMCHT